MGDSCSYSFIRYPIMWRAAVKGGTQTLAPLFQRFGSPQINQSPQQTATQSRNNTGTEGATGHSRQRNVATSEQERTLSEEVNLER